MAARTEPIVPPAPCLALSLTWLALVRAHARQVMRLAAHAVRFLGFPPHAINILTFYNAQRELLENLAKREGLEVPVLSVDSMQGREADLIILSCVRAEVGGGLGFVADAKRVNVALSRARESLVVVGSKQCLEVERIWHASFKLMQKFAGAAACVKEIEGTIPRGWGAPRVVEALRDRRGERSSADKEFEEEEPAPAPAEKKLEQRDSGIPDDWDASSEEGDAPTVGVGDSEPPEGWDAADGDSSEDGADGGPSSPPAARSGERFSQTSDGSVVLGVS